MNPPTAFEKMRANRTKASDRIRAWNALYHHRHQDNERAAREDKPLPYPDIEPPEILRELEQVRRMSREQAPLKYREYPREPAPRNWWKLT